MTLPNSTLYPTGRTPPFRLGRLCPNHTVFANTGRCLSGEGLFGD